MQLFLNPLTFLLFCLGLIYAQLEDDEWKLFITPESATLTMHRSEMFYFNISGPAGEAVDHSSLYYLILDCENDRIASLDQNETRLANYKNEGNFNITGRLLGKTKVFVKLFKNASTRPLIIQELALKVIREKSTIDSVFTTLIGVALSLMYINFGSALKWNELRTNLKKPIGPAIGFTTQFLLMPLLSYGLGLAIFPNNPEMQLGLFITGVAPGGGISNIYVAILNGNLDLSVTMTTISTIAAFAMIPLWIFTLGRVIFNQEKLTIPYMSITTSALSLIVPLLIGFLIQRYLKNVQALLHRISKIMSFLLIASLIIIGSISNTYLWELYSKKVLIASISLPWMAYTLAFIISKILKQSSRDSFTIAIETGIQNVMISVLILNLSLPQPQADITAILPMTVASMSPIPLLIILVIKKIYQRYSIYKENKSKGINQLNDNSDLKHESTRCLP